MAKYEFWALGETSVTVSGGGSLDGGAQGDGSHLLGLEITLTAANFEKITLNDNELYVDDDDGKQKLHQSQSFDGVSYANNTDVEMEYTLTLLDPSTGIEYTALAVNFDTTGPNNTSIEGIVFVDEIPPIGVTLTVVGTAEGPGGNGQDPIRVTDLAVPCFTPGTLIETPDGPRRVETLRAGDTVLTLDNGPQRLIWAGQTELSSLRLALHPELRPIRIRAHAFGPGRPARDMRVSPQHRILVDGWQAEMLFGEHEVLVAAAHLVNDHSVQRVEGPESTTYIHLQCAGHEVLMSDGLPSESFNPGPVAVGALDLAARAELQALFPECDLMERAPLRSARPMLRAHEARLLVA